VRCFGLAEGCRRDPRLEGESDGEDEGSDDDESELLRRDQTLIGGMKCATGYFRR
jgi:hypothetical protein